MAMPVSNPVWGGSGSGPAAFQVGHRCQEELGAALPGYPHLELLQPPGGAQGDGGRGWHEAGCPHVRGVPPRCTMASHSSGGGMPLPLCSPCIVSAICPSAGHRTRIPPVTSLCNGSRGFQITCRQAAQGGEGAGSLRAGGAAVKAEPFSAREGRAVAALL